MSIEKITVKDAAHFREMVRDYWQELIPKADVATDPDKWEAHFQDQFAWDGGNNHPHWATLDSRRIGFMTFEVSDDHMRARVNNFYVVPEERCKGCGSAMVRWLFSHFDSLGVERIDLDVRRDNPTALAFWQAQGFGIAGYRLRQYRDPETGTAYVGALSSDLR